MAIVTISADEWLSNMSVDGGKWLFRRVKRALENDDRVVLDFRKAKTYNAKELEIFLQLSKTLPYFLERVEAINTTPKIRKEIERIIPSDQ